MPSLVVVSHPEKVLFPDPGVTKGEVAEYYHRVADVMLPHLNDRPLTIQRFPQGIEKQGFMQKHAGKGFPDYIDRIELAKQDGTVNYPIIRDEMGLAYLANQNTITFHIPGFRASHLEHPDRMVFDLDPSEGDLDGVRYAARATAEFLGALDVPTWLMTSGSKGFHLVTNLQPTIGFDEMGRFAQAVALLGAVKAVFVLRPEQIAAATADREHHQQHDQAAQRAGFLGLRRLGGVRLRWNRLCRHWTPMCVVSFLC